LYYIGSAEGHEYPDLQIGEKYISVGKCVTKIFGLAVVEIGLVYAVRYL
jgi:hypothetical protein